MNDTVTSWMILVEERISNTMKDGQGKLGQEFIGELRSWVNQVDNLSETNRLTELSYDDKSTAHLLEIKLS